MNNYYTEDEWGDILFEKELEIRKISDLNVKKKISLLNKEFENFENEEANILKMLFSLDKKQFEYEEVVLKLGYSERKSKEYIKNALNKFIVSYWALEYLPENINKYKTPKKIKIIKNNIKNLKD